MRERLYGELTPWYRLVDPPADHEGEVRAYRVALQRGATPAPKTLLELGSGAGHNAVHLKAHFECTLSDLSPEMLALSRELHPELEHHLGDLRTLRLGQTFDTVLLHDAVTYMRTEADLAKAIETIDVHLRPGGAAVIAPDVLREDLKDESELLACDEGHRSLRAVMWSWDPDPEDTTFITEYAFLLRENGKVTAVHDSHVEGVFPKATWLRLLEARGFSVETFPRPMDDEGQFDEVFLLRKPA